MPLMNKKVLGRMKDECAGKIMTEFIGLRSKMYAYKTEEKNTVKKLKGIKKSVIERKIQFEDYQRCLFDSENLLVTMNIIRSQKHNLFTIKQNKLDLSSKDEKRYVSKNSVNTLPYGHYSINFTS